MRDEILDKAISTDANVIPRYDVVAPDGTVVVENVQLVLKNTVRTEGTPLNTNTLLSHNTAMQYGLATGLSEVDAVPDDIFNLIYNMLPRARITFPYKANWIVGGGIPGRWEFPNATTGLVVFSSYDTQHMLASDSGDIVHYTTIPVDLSVDTSKIYNIEFQPLNITIHVTSRTPGIVKALSPVDSSVLDSAELEYVSVATGYEANLNVNAIAVSLVLYDSTGEVVVSKSQAFRDSDANSTVDVSMGV